MKINIYDFNKQISHTNYALNSYLSLFCLIFLEYNYHVSKVLEYFP